MKEEKQIIIDGILERINASPFLLVTDYTGMNVSQFEELRKRLRDEAGSQYHVAKNSLVKRASSSMEFPEDLASSLAGQTAIVTGDQDVCAAAKVLDAFAEEFEKPVVRAGVLDGKMLTPEDVKALLELPSKEVLQAQFLGALQQPGTNLVRLLNEPAASLVRVLNEPASSLLRVLQARVAQG